MLFISFFIPAGQMYSTYIYKFACFGSCAGGPNRRPLMLIFTLESGYVRLFIWDIVYYLGY